MAKPEWGIKRTCHTCGKKYYDLNNSPIICPSCGTEFDPDYYLKSKKSKSVSSKNSSGNTNVLSNDIEAIDEIENIDEIEGDTDSEVVSDDDPLMEINKEDQNVIKDDEISLDNDISFIEDEEVSNDNGVDVETSEDDKN